MELIAGSFLFALTAVNCYVIARLYKPSSLIDAVLLLFVIFCSITVLAGHATSLADSFGSTLSWILAQLIVLFLAGGTASLRSGLTAPLIRHHARGLYRLLSDTKAGLSPFEKAILYPATITLAILGICNVILTLFVAPHTWDSMTYHLARMGYYIQQGNLSHFDANYWAQIVHPINATILLAFSYLASGGNENLTQVVQLCSYWVAVLSVYGISRAIGQQRSASLLSALTFGLLINCLMEATSAQNDLLLTALIAVSAYFLFRASVTRTIRLLLPSSVALGLALGVKESSLLAVPSIVLLSIYLFSRWPTADRRLFRKPLFIFAVLTIASVSVFTLPSGYTANTSAFGHPLGPDSVRHEHSFEGHSAEEVLVEGSKNVLRYVLDFFSFDGFPHAQIVTGSQHTIRSTLVSWFQEAGVDVTADRGTREQFSVSRMPSAHEDYSYWGILGFCLIWIMVILLAAGIPRSGSGRILAYATLLFFLVQCFAGPYDPWRGRYFTLCAVFATPAVGYSLKWIRSNPIWLYLTLVLALGCMSALSAVLVRPIDLDLVPWVREQSIISLIKRDRMQQLTTNNRYVYEPLTRLEEMVPPSADLAVCLGPNGYEYPLFGKEHARRLIPVHSFRSGLRPVPSNVSYLLFSSDILTPEKSDELLGNRWYLRRLHATDGGKEPDE
jgi:hypothetical protein